MIMTDFYLIDRTKTAHEPIRYKLDTLLVELLRCMMREKNKKFLTPCVMSTTIRLQNIFIFFINVPILNYIVVCMLLVKLLVKLRLSRDFTLVRFECCC